MSDHAGNHCLCALDLVEAQHDMTVQRTIAKVWREAARKLEAERARLSKQYDRMKAGHERVVLDLVAERDRLREALGRIAEDGSPGHDWRMDIARAALSPEEDCACPPGAGGSDDCPTHWR